MHELCPLIRAEEECRIIDSIAEGKSAKYGYGSNAAITKVHTICVWCAKIKMRRLNTYNVQQCSEIVAAWKRDSRNAIMLRNSTRWHRLVKCELMDDVDGIPIFGPPARPREKGVHDVGNRNRNSRKLEPIPFFWGAPKHPKQTNTKHSLAYMNQCVQLIRQTFN